MELGERHKIIAHLVKIFAMPAQKECQHCKNGEGPFKQDLFLPGYLQPHNLNDLGPLLDAAKDKVYFTVMLGALTLTHVGN